jgi:hypothetical protein
VGIEQAARLSAGEVKAYRESGIVVPRYRLPAAQLAGLRAALEQLLVDNPGVRPEKLVCPHLEQGGEGVRGNPKFLEIARDPAIVELVAEVIGDDVILWGCQVFCKPGGDGMAVPWHQDGQYWPIRPLATCTVWIAIDDSLVENGCLRVVPRSHRRAELLDHARSDRSDIVLDQELDASTFDEASAFDVELEAGQMSLHDVYLIHGSNANRSTRRRAGLALRYMPASSHFDRQMFGADGSTKSYKIDFANRPIWLVRGSARCAMNDFTTGHGPH